MKKTKKNLMGLLVSSLVLAAGTAHAEHTRVTYPSAVAIEGLGRAAVWSVSYDRVVDDNLAAGLGFSAFSVDNATGGSDTVTVVPFYANYYFMKEQGTPYLTAGFDIIGNKQPGSAVGDVKLDKSVVGVVGLGYESRSDNGFLVRVTGYGLIADKVYPWGGITLGYAF
jgi:hypothetical protein